MNAVESIDRPGASRTRPSTPEPSSLRAVAIGCAGALVLAAGVGLAPPAQAADLTAAVNVTNRTGPQVPLDFIGMSIEYTSVLDWYGSPGRPNRAFEKLLRNHGAGIMRFGGDSQDKGCWGKIISPCNYRITPARLGVIGAGSAASGWRAHLGTNLARRDAGGVRVSGARNTVDFIKKGVFPAFAGPRRPLFLGLGIGNEPNRYQRNKFRRGYSRAKHAADFKRQVTAIRQDRDPAVRGVAVSGPAYATRSRWGTYIDDFLDPARSGGVNFATDHYYATNTCSGKKPTIDQLLSRGVAATADREVRESVVAAATRGRPLRMDETNSAACRGQRGVSDVMASAIWGLDYMFRAANAGAVGVGFHIAGGGAKGRFALYNAINARPANTGGGYVTDAKPLYHATRMFGRSAKGGRLTPVALGNPSAMNVTAWATNHDDGSTRVVLINKQTGPGTARVTISPSAKQPGVPARAIRMTADGGSLRNDVVRVGGSRCDNSGTCGNPAQETIPATNGNYVVNLGYAQALTVTIP